ncbi:MAG TPA: cation transporter, partial [Corynebacterium sp.]|nr:cation transporter [Corynebacterium sp.]
MAHDHDHRDAPLRALGIAALITGTIFTAELVGGLVSGSLALLSDAMHMLSDAAGLLIALL